jgi:hypothetical protein
MIDPYYCLMPEISLVITVPREVAEAAQRAADRLTEGNLSAYAIEPLRVANRNAALDGAIALQEAETGIIPDEEVDALWRKYGLD